MSAQLSPTRIYKSWRNDGTPNANGTMATYIAGTTTPQATWIDSTQTTQNTNPITFNARGEANVWLDATLIYEFIEYDSSGTLIGVTDNINFSYPVYFPATAAEIAAGVTIVNYGYEPGDVRRYGAIGDGATDDYLAFAAALSASKLVYVSPTSSGYRLSTGITITSTVTMYSNSFLPGNSLKGTRLIFDLSVPTLVTMGGPSATNGTPGLIGVSVTRAAGTIPAGSVGILVQRVYNVNLRDVSSTRSSINWNFVNGGSNGISANAANLHSAAATDVHWQFDGWPEFRCMGGRTGENGAGDDAGASYIRFQGGSGGGSGPNTICFVGHQFNQGTASTGHWLIFNHPSSPSTSALEFRFIGCHVEGLTGALITSDASTTLINRLQIASSTINCTSSDFFGLDAGTKPSSWQFIGNELFCSTFTLAQSVNIDFLAMSANLITGVGSITSGSSGSTASLNGNTWQNGLTLAGDWAQLQCNDMATAGTTAVTVTGDFSIDIPNRYKSGSMIFTKNTAYTTKLSDANKTIYHSDGTARTYTIDSNANVPYPLGTVIYFSNNASAAVNVSIAITTDTLLLSPGGTTGTRTLAQYGTATARKVDTTIWVIWGNGLT